METEQVGKRRDSGDSPNQTHEEGPATSKREPRMRSPTRSRGRDGEDKQNTGCLFVGNIPFHFKEEDVADIFGKIGPIDYVTIGIDKRTGHRKGHAFVQFVNPKDAQTAFNELQGHDISGRRLRIDWDAGLNKKRTPSRGGREGFTPYERPLSRSGPSNYGRPPRRNRSPSPDRYRRHPPPDRYYHDQFPPRERSPPYVRAPGRYPPERHGYPMGRSPSPRGRSPPMYSRGSPTHHIRGRSPVHHWRSPPRDERGYGGMPHYPPRYYDEIPPGDPIMYRHMREYSPPPMRGDMRISRDPLMRGDPIMRGDPRDMPLRGDPRGEMRGEMPMRGEGRGDTMKGDPRGDPRGPRVDQTRGDPMRGDPRGDPRGERPRGEPMRGEGRGEPMRRHDLSPGSRNDRFGISESSSYFMHWTFG